ncbi:hypothetical protein [Gilvimarinus xylanilyticus]|uniref:Apea-like HEPN domain-containing protein n=1 Tax=Gilvimarinus xylanilyticus TaxID=2944139 RepID=A0A9X2KT79_9GAMM|nr:hypothetical protein [Gilvimarinus xylanilyticus]MCP8898994.1 hypothetical protein [Gilvimarinus xylanilyticus]
MKIDVTVYAVLPYLWLTQDERRLQVAACKEIATHSASLIPQDYYGAVRSFHAKTGPEIGSFPRLESVWREKLPIPYRVVEFAAEFEIDLSEVQLTSSDPDAPPVTLEMKESCAQYEARNHIESFVRDLVVALNISKPGSLHISKTVALVNELPPSEGRGMVTSVGDALALAQELGWPLVNELELTTVWNWISCVSASKSDGARRLRRALCCFTHLLNDVARGENTLGLVWALTALEAIYGEGNISAKAQILKKSESLLGPRVEHKKKFSWMYDFRSRLLHGDVDISPSYSSNWLGNEGKFDEDGYSCQLLAVSVLVATFQELCKREASGVQFKQEPCFETRA